MEKDNRVIRARTRIGVKICNHFVDELRKSDFFINKFLPRFTDCLESLKPRQITKVVCYGLGSFHKGLCLAPRHQLALLLLIYELLSDCVTEPIEIYDPHFEPEDEGILKSFLYPKFQLLNNNELCARVLDTTTLVYMPHLDKHFYNNIIGSNWTSENLARLILMGNSFQAMVANTIPSNTKKVLHYINLLVDNFEPNLGRQREKCLRRLQGEDTREKKPMAMIEISVASNDDEFRYSFSDQSIHFLNVQWLNENKDTLASHRLNNWQPIEDFEY